jgi:hypothetical protein
MPPMNRLVQIAVCAAFSLAAACACGLGVDPAPPTFLVGASLGDDATIDLHIIDCGGGPLRALDVERVGSDDRRTPLWGVATVGSNGPVFEPGRPHTMTIGTTPTGMREALPLTTDITAEKRLGAGVNFTGQPDASYGFFFDVHALVPDRVWIASGSRKGQLLTSDEFREKGAELCSLSN